MNSKEFIENLQSIRSNSGKMAFLRGMFMENSSYQRQALVLLAIMNVPVSEIDIAIPYMATAYAFAVLKGETGCSFPIALKKATAENPFDKRFDRMLSCSNVNALVKQHLPNVISVLKSKNIGINYDTFLNDLINWKSIKNKWIEEYYC